MVPGVPAPVVLVVGTLTGGTSEARGPGPLAVSGDVPRLHSETRTG